MNLPRECPGQISWHYDRAEIIADGVVHAIGVCLGLIGAVTLVVMAVKIERIDVAPILVYVFGLITMLAFSAAYNMWPVSPVKWVLRRFDHSAIYLLIAGTYTPFVGHMKNALASAGLGIGVWLSAAVGMALKLALPGRFERLAVILCLLLGWSGVEKGAPCLLDLVKIERAVVVRVKFLYRAWASRLSERWQAGAKHATDNQDIQNCRASRYHLDNLLGWSDPMALC